MKPRKRIGRYAARFIMEAVLILICAILAITIPVFRSGENVMNLLNAVALPGLIALGMTMVIISGEIDLSVGSAVAFSGCLTAFLVSKHWPVPAAMVTALIAGFLLGSLTGVLRTRFQVPSFITTLALYTALRGGAYLLTGGFALTPFPRWYSVLGSGYIAGMPVPVIVLLVGFLIFHFVMNYTSFGRSVYALGGNAAAARLCGINVARSRILVTAITGMLAALAGVILASKINSGTPTVAVGWELQVIAAVIIGGTSFTGGIGTVWGTLIGVVFIGVIMNGMTLLNVDQYLQLIVQGALILVAVLVNRFQSAGQTSG